MDNSDVRAVLRELQEIKAALVLLITVQQYRPDEIKQVRHWCGWELALPHGRILQ